MTGRVGFPSMRSVPTIFPVFPGSPVTSRVSSTIWNAVPMPRANCPTASRWAPSAPDTAAPDLAEASKSLAVLLEMILR